MSNWDPEDPVTHRTLYYERIQQGDQTMILFSPFYQVRYPGLHGKAFEPVDILKRKQLGGDVNNSSEYAMKVVNEMREYDGRQRLFVAETSPDQTDIVLHNFSSWEWPR